MEGGKGQWGASEGPGWPGGACGASAVCTGLMGAIRHLYTAAASDTKSAILSVNSW